MGVVAGGTPRPTACVLSPLQRRLASLVVEVPEADGFAIAGGAALILQGQLQRVTTDLDYFATSPQAVDALLPALEAKFEANGLTVERRQVASGFARLTVYDGPDSCQIDLGYDFRLRDPTPTPLGPVLSLEELAADKVLAVHGRAEGRDYADLYVLTKLFGMERPLEWAAQKDPGFSPAVFAERLGRVAGIPRKDLALSDAERTVMVRDLSGWSQRLLALEIPPPGHRRGVDPPGLHL